MKIRPTDPPGRLDLPADHVLNGPAHSILNGERQYRRTAPKKSAAEIAEIQARRWATRREKYGPDGHR